MNLGIRDAVGLGGVIAAHLKLSQSPPDETADVDKVLRDYASARYARAVSTIRLTKRLAMLTNVMQASAFNGLLYWVIKVLGSIGLVRRLMAWRLSGLGSR